MTCLGDLVTADMVPRRTGADMARRFNVSHYAEHVQELARVPGRRRSLRARRMAVMIAVLVGLAALTAGCGGSTGPGGSGSAKSRLLAYAGCMRTHGVSDFPDPITLPGGGFAFQINAGPGSRERDVLLRLRGTRARRIDAACRGTIATC